MKKKINYKKGFLLAELIVATTLFIIVVSISLGSLVSILDSSRRVRGNKDAMDNLNTAIEYMARIVRFGEIYWCGIPSDTVPNPLIPQNCSGPSQLAVRFNGQTWVFMRQGNSIQVSEQGGVSGSWRPLTAQNIVIEKLQFIVLGTNKTDNTQPYVLVLMRGRVMNDPNSYALFDVQTMMSQRKIDLNI